MPTTSRLSTCLALLLAGCAPPGASVPGTAMSLLAVREATAVVQARPGRTPLASGRFELATGQFLAADDGMGPAGDVWFFHDGQRFLALANQGGGARRTLSPAGASNPGNAPVPLTAGAELLLEAPGGRYRLVITQLLPGTLVLGPGRASGEGTVRFRYEGISLGRGWDSWESASMPSSIPRSR